MKRFKLLIIICLCIGFFSGGYIGYLSALVDRDEALYIQEVNAVTDQQVLEQQLRRAKSIVSARRRAYQRSRQVYLETLKEQEKKIEALSSEILESKEKPKKIKTLTVEKENLLKVKEENTENINREKKDLQFFEDQLQLVEKMVEVAEQDKAHSQLASQEDLNTQKILSFNKIQLLIDKRKQLAQEQKALRTGYQYFQQRVVQPPEDIIITVIDKSGLKRQLNPIHSSQLANALSIMPNSFHNNNMLKRFYIVYGDENMRRGMTGLGVVFMKGENLDFFRVLIHELGHIVDLHRESQSNRYSEFFDGSYRLPVDDPSVDFYRISWENNFSKKVEKNAFVSGYSQSDPFEDFAETFALYVLQQPTFTKWSEDNSSLFKKFQFVSKMYDGREFQHQEVYSARPFDVTQMTVDYSLLLDEN